MREVTKSSLRWILVLPGAIIGAFLSSVSLHLILYFSLAHGETISGVDIRPIEHSLYPFILAMTFVLVGAEIAPKQQFQVAIGLAILYLIGAICVLFFASTVGVHMFIEMRSIGPIIGLLIAVFIIWKKFKS